MDAKKNILSGSDDKTKLLDSSLCWRSDSVVSEAGVAGAGCARSIHNSGFHRTV